MYTPIFSYHTAGCAPKIIEKQGLQKKLTQSTGQYGMIHDKSECYQCVDDRQCDVTNNLYCDVLQHKCVKADCLRDEHCHDDDKDCDVHNRVCRPGWVTLTLRQSLAVTNC